MEDKELFNRLDNNELFERIHDVANKIVNEDLEPEESYNLLSNEFKLTWNQNNEVEWIANKLLNDITKEINKRKSINKELWDELENSLRGKYNCEKCKLRKSDEEETKDLQEINSENSQS